MPPALAHFFEHDAKPFALAARRSKSLHQSWVHPPTEPGKVVDLARKRQGPTNFGYLIHECDTGAIAGYIEITNIVRGPFQSAYLGFYMFKGYERRGYMKRALGVIIKRAWRELKLHRLEANIQPENAASVALVKSLGFSKEGYSPAYLKIGGRWRDHERWAILANSRSAASQETPSCQARAAGHEGGQDTGAILGAARRALARQQPLERRLVGHGLLDPFP
jgi:ribosomal-protein-alanine N-acetyltransferase